MPLVRLGKLLIATVNGFLLSDGLTLAAAISFYAALSVSPLFILLFWSANKLGISDQERILVQISEYAGPQTTDLARAILQNLQSSPDLGNLAGLLGFGILLLSAAGVFGQLRLSLNRMWNISEPAHFSLAIWLRRRLLAIAMVFVLAVFIPLSLLSTSAITFVTGLIGRENWSPLLLEAFNASLSLVLFSSFFAMVFRYLPDAAPAWRDIRVGAFVTALLFTLGKTLIGIYLGYSSVSSAFGAAGSLAVFLIWVYYSAAIFLFGAELTQQRSILGGRGEAIVRRRVGENEEKA